MFSTDSFITAEAAFRAQRVRDGWGQHQGKGRATLRRRDRRTGDAGE
jgi:hypothetical protein